MSIVTRFAPSPTGFLHLGHAHAALTAWSAARRARGSFLLRIEDIDPGRCRPAFAAAIMQDLAWLGLDWDGSLTQSKHLADYAAALDDLRRRGLIYPCFCTRADIAQAAAAPHEGAAAYPGTCRRLADREREDRIAAGAPHAWRLDMTRALSLAGELSFQERGETTRCDPAPFGDVVLARKDAPASYHLCATHDDALQGVTLVTRGADLLPATHVHRLLQALMGWPTPAYAHHALLAGPSGRRLAKRDAAASLRELRASGASPEAVRAMAGHP
jgi:glutamyl-Q tRNA(Asp) synthetase